MNVQRPNCRSCKYFYVTWDTMFPYGCKLFKVKSKQMPDVLVYESIGRACDHFGEKQK